MLVCVLNGPWVEGVELIVVHRSPVLCSNDNVLFLHWLVLFLVGGVEPRHDSQLLSLPSLQKLLGQLLFLSKDLSFVKGDEAVSLKAYKRMQKIVRSHIKL